MPTAERPRAPLLAALLLLTGCAMPPVLAPQQSQRPQPRAAAVTPPAPIESDIATVLRAREDALRARGGLRVDDGSAQRVDADTMARIYVEIALTDEYSQSAGAFLARRAPGVLRRWGSPVRLNLEFGPSVPPLTRMRDRQDVDALAARLSTVARHPVALLPGGSGGANFHVLVLSESERRAIGPRIAALVPGIDTATLNLIENLPLSANCIALAFSRSGTAVYTDAIAIIRAEQPDLTRRACYQEEIAQGLGLASDSDRARPSLFNDTAEFAVLTWLDLALLRLHYDPRLRPGMTAEQALPIVRAIAAELVGGAS